VPTPAVQAIVDTLAPAIQPVVDAVAELTRVYGRCALLGDYVSCSATCIPCESHPALRKRGRTMSAQTNVSGLATIHCPVCHGEAPADAVFCGNPACGKALGEFRYVKEEVQAHTSAIQRLADRVNEWSGRPHFVTLHAVWFLAWIAINSGLITVLGAFDDYPYGLLGIILSIEAILLTGFLLISNNRQNEYANRRAELDYEVNVRSYRKLCALEHELAALKQRLEVGK
jgi:low affinity Fe/Cu permease